MKKYEFFFLKFIINMEKNENIVNELVKQLLVIIESKKIGMSSAIHLIVSGMELLEEYPNLSGKEKRQLLIVALTDIAKGNDGILGTSDDLISPFVLHQLETMLIGNLIEDVISVIIDAASGKLNIRKTMQVAEQVIAETSICCFKMCKKKTK